jgi:Uma2 family endonuclease
MYPDAVIVCGEPETVDRQFDTLKNPMVIFEILSPSTADHDRSRKFYYYRQIPSFREYVLIDSLEPFIESHLKQADGSWRSDATGDPHSSVLISSVHTWISLEEIYRNVLVK